MDATIGNKRPAASSRFSVYNESNLVHISPSLLEKLVEGKGKQVQQMEPAAAAAASFPASNNEPKLLISSGGEEPKTKLSASFASANTADDASLNALQQAYERQLKAQEGLWRQKAQRLEQLNDQLLKAASLKLAEEVGHFERRHFGTLGLAAATSAYTESPCQAAESAVIECYSRNGKRSLHCSEVVKHFSECVRSASFDFLGGR